MKDNIAQWSVIGAGPAGIAAVGKLLDYGVLPNDILWVDPDFKVGDLGRLWRNVSSNTNVKIFLDFLHSAKSFNYQTTSKEFTLNKLQPSSTCILKEIVAPLQWITKHLLLKVNAERTTLTKLILAQRTWILHTDSQVFRAKNVILATGANPLRLSYPNEEVSLHVALDREKFQHLVDVSHTYAVFGSSHSAIIVLQNLVDLGVKKIINFYRSPCRYAFEMENGTLFDNSGLKGQAAIWARNNIDGALPPNLVRYQAEETSIDKLLPFCDKVIYAIGFARRQSLIIDGYADNYHPNIGIIAPGLFGLGIGYPELKSDAYGNIEFQVGLWKFMVYLQKVMPIWFRYHT